MAHVREKLRFVLARLRELAALVLDFIEQTHVLDGDHRLVGEGGGKLDLPVVERSNRAAHQYDDADRNTLAQQRNAQKRANTDLSDRSQGVVGIVQYIRDLDGPA